MDELGFWSAQTDGVLRARLCQGPATVLNKATLDRVASVSECSASSDTQYYFVGNETAPETLELCPATCAAVAAIPGTPVELEIPCAPPKPPALVTEHVQLYQPECQGTPQWDFLYYDAVTPADSRVEFEVRSALSEDDLLANTGSRKHLFSNCACGSSPARAVKARSCAIGSFASRAHPHSDRRSARGASRACSQPDR
jgi:hypothetical protein